MGVAMQTLMLFVDGLGLGEPDPAFNPIVAGACPALARLLAEHASPVDARLGVPGLPQSATGQTALLTGVNAASLAGRHIEGFPGPLLREVVRERNLLSALRRRGCAPAFANAYYLDPVTARLIRRKASVTTVATMAALGGVRGPDRMLAGEAVYHDLTREALRPRGYDGPLCTPEQAARDLAGIWAAHDFTLFEFFLTDRAGHRRDPAYAAAVLGLYDRFLAVLLEAQRAAPGRLLTLISDHGNIEDLRVPTHTLNPVPLAAVGPGADFLRSRVRRLDDFAPAVLELYPERKKTGDRSQ